MNLLVTLFGVSCIIVAVPIMSEIIYTISDTVSTESLMNTRYYFSIESLETQADVQIQSA